MPPSEVRHGNAVPHRTGKELPGRDIGCAGMGNLQPVYRSHPFIMRDGIGRGRTDAYIRDRAADCVGADVFARGLCLPSDNKMTEEEQDVVIEVIRRCFL